MSDAVAPPPVASDTHDRLGVLASCIASGGPSAREAEGELLSALSPRVHRFARCRLRDASLARDFAQEALLVVLEGVRSGRLERPEAIVSFALSTCKALARGERRTAERRARLLSVGMPDVGTGDDGAADFEERLGRLGECLQRLGDRHKQVVFETFYMGRPAPETAAALGTTTGNVRVLRHRALEMLRECVDRQEHRP
jgi:RNA polymerase sigma-70 factor (ECF subfamily)